MYAVAYDGIIARVIKAGPEDIGVTYSEAANQALEHMRLYRDIKARELIALNTAIANLE